MKKGTGRNSRALFCFSSSPFFLSPSPLVGEGGVRGKETRLLRGKAPRNDYLRDVETSLPPDSFYGPAWQENRLLFLLYYCKFKKRTLSAFVGRGSRGTMHRAPTKDRRPKGLPYAG